MTAGRDERGDRAPPSPAFIGVNRAGAYDPGVRKSTKDLWAEQDQHEGDRWRLFGAIGDAIDPDSVLYPGSFVDVAPSFVFRSVTYIDVDRNAAKFFADDEGVREIISAHNEAPADPRLRFLNGDYTEDLGLPEDEFDLLISLYAGFVSEHCTNNLRVGGTLLANSSHGDVALASIDRRYRLAGVLLTTEAGYRYSTGDLDAYLVPTPGTVVTRESIHQRRRGFRYTRSAFAYAFERIR